MPLDKTVKLAVPCLKCGHKVEETIARLETSPNLTCPACGAFFKYHAEDFRRNFKKADEALAKLGWNLKRIFK